MTAREALTALAVAHGWEPLDSISENVSNWARGHVTVAVTYTRRGSVKAAQFFHAGRTAPVWAEAQGKREQVAAWLTVEDPSVAPELLSEAVLSGVADENADEAAEPVRLTADELTEGTRVIDMHGVAGVVVKRSPTDSVTIHWDNGATHSAPAHHFTLWAEPVAVVANAEGDYLTPAMRTAMNDYRAAEVAANIVANDPAMLAEAVANARALTEAEGVAAAVSLVKALPEGCVAVPAGFEAADASRKEHLTLTERIHHGDYYNERKTDVSLTGLTLPVLREFLAGSPYNGQPSETLERAIAAVWAGLADEAEGLKAQTAMTTIATRHAEYGWARYVLARESEGKSTYVPARHNHARYARSFPFENGEMVTQGHVDYCDENGHAIVIDGYYCPRCGTVTENPNEAVPMSLSDVMEFGHAVTVLEDGRVFAASRFGINHAPESIVVTHDENGKEFVDLCGYERYGWATFTDGCSQQYSYRGPVMHSSEQLSGWLSRMVLLSAGHYVAVTVDDGDCEPYGWAILKRDLELPEAVAFQTDVYGQRENDLFVARFADSLLADGGGWAEAELSQIHRLSDDEATDASEFVDELAQTVLYNNGYTLQWDNGAFIYRTADLDYWDPSANGYNITDPR